MLVQVLTSVFPIQLPITEPGDGSSSRAPTALGGDLNKVSVEAVWPSPGFCRHLGNEAAAGGAPSSPCLSVSSSTTPVPACLPLALPSPSACIPLCHFAFQVDVNK